MDAASKSLQDVLVEVYEPEWVGQPQMQAIAEQLQQARFEHLRKLNDDLQNNVAVYLIQFPEAKVCCIFGTQELLRNAIASWVDTFRFRYAEISDVSILMPDSFAVHSQGCSW